MHAKQLPGKWLFSIAVLATSTLIFVAAGCRSPWRIGRSSPPDFDDLIEIERRSSGSDDSKAKMSNPASLSADARFPVARPPKWARESAEDLSADDQFAAEYEQAPPEKQAMLDRILSRLPSSARKLRGGESQRTPPEMLANGSQPSDSSQPELRRPQRDSQASSRGIEDSPNEEEQSSEIAMRFTDDQETDEAPRPKNTPRPDPADSTVRDLALGSEALVRPAVGGAPVDNLGPDETIERQASHTEPVADTDRERTAHRTDNVIGPPGSEKTIAPGATVDRDLSTLDFRELGHAMIQQLEKSYASASNPDERIDLAKKRRLLNLVMDDIDSAQDPIEGLQPEAAEYVRHTFQGLYDATNIEGNPVASRRLTLALQSHRKAAESLAKLAILEVNNLAFCTEVDSFGVITKFPHYQFRADQEVLLYCELKNFVSEPVRGGFETQLQGSYEIVNAKGRRVADQILPEDSDICGNQRQDFYIAYRLHLPADMEPGDYQFKLTIEDMKGQKFGQSMVEFKVIR